MKRLLVMLGVAAAVSVASAAIKDTQLFESTFADFVADTSGEDASELVDHSTAPSIDVPYPCEDFGEKYLSLDTGDATLWRTLNVSGSVYFDMAVQFNASSTALDVSAVEDAKIAVYLNAASNIVIVAGAENDENRTPTNYVTTATVPSGTWARLTISAVQTETEGLAFQVRVNGTLLATESGIDAFPCLTSSTVVTQVGLKGSGSLDNFVARTTDPFIEEPGATIGGEGYAELDDALAEADANTVVTLQADATSALSLAAGDSYKIALNGHNFGGFTANGDTALSSSTDANGVTTYSGTAGVAAVYDDNDAWVWFASFADAFTYARVQQLQPKMKFKVGSDFTPDISSNLTVWTLEFIATTEDPITINLANGNAKLVSSRITFPTTATLNAVSGNVNSMSGGTLNVPSGVVLELASYATDGSSWNITGLTGSGTIKNDGKSMYFFLGNTQYNLPTRMRESSWCGTLELCGSNTWEAEFNKFANANSKVRFNGLTTPLYTSGNDSVAIELVGSGLTISGAYESARTYTVGGTITGSGALTLADNTGSLLLSGDTSGFTGSVAASGTSAAVTFGSATTGKGQRIVVQAGKTATIGAGATWTATNLILLGELTVNGTLEVNDNCIWGDKGAGVLRYANKDTLPTSAKFAGSWNSKCIIACDPGNTRFVLNNFGNAKSTLEIAGDNGVFSAFPSTENTDGTAPSINPAVILTANWTVNNGWAATDKVTTFSKLSGSGNLTVNGSTSGNTKIYYAITKLDNYTGTLGGRRASFTIGDVNVDEAPEANEVVVKTEKGAYGEFPGTPAVTVDGGATNYKLVYATVNSTEGLYLAVAQVGDVCYATYDAAFAAAATAEAEEVLALVDTQYPAPEGWKIDSETGNYVKKVYVAKIEGGASYETLAEAVSNATSGATVTLLDDITLDARVEPNVGANTTLAINLGGFTITRTGTSGNGSVFDVKSGAVTITNGVINCKQDDTDIVADGVYAITVRSGAALTLDDLTVTVNSQAGACVYPFNGATVTILGGTYGNETADAYQYHANWTGMAVNQANVATQLITIYGGSFYKVDPSLGDDSWAEGAGTFLAPGKATTLEGDYWVVDTATYTVRFLDGENGNVLSSQTVSYGETATAPAENPTKAGYAFKGWSGDVTAEITADTDFIAQWNAYVAQIAGGDSYETVVAALEAAQDGQTVKLLANTCERVYATVNCNVTLDINGKTMTSPVDDVIVKNGTGTLTIQDSAETLGLVQSTINGVDLGVAVWVRQGSAVIKSGVFENNSNYEATVYVSNGASCTIEGGTFSNVATGEYHWKAGWKPITLNVQNGHASGAAAISVSGGSFTTDPANGDDKFGGTFLADGKATTLEGGYYVVGEAETPVAPGETDGKTYETQADAEAAAAQVTIAPAADVATALGEDAAVKAAYLGKFEAKAVPDGTGGYKVEVGLTTDAVAALTTDATDAAETVADSLTAIAATAAGAQTEVTVQNAEPGFYYSIGYATSLGQEYTEGARALAGADGSVTLATPAKAENATAGFYKVFVNVQDK